MVKTKFATKESLEFEYSGYEKLRNLWTVHLDNTWEMKEYEDQCY